MRAVRHAALLVGLLLAGLAPAGAHDEATVSHCELNRRSLCLLEDRFQVQVRVLEDDTWRSARARGVSDVFGFFWVDGRGDPEVAVKMVDGTEVNDAFWVLSGSFTELEHEIVVRDTGSGRVRRYTVPAGGPAVQDREAFVNSRTRPQRPVITEPASNGENVSVFDVHMETGPFDDADRGDGHYCTDWEIWTLSSPDLNVAQRDERVWAAECAVEHSRTHIHQGDGDFLGGRAEHNFLESGSPHMLRVRHRDTSGLWSRWAERTFRTSAIVNIRSLELRGVQGTPLPRWEANGALVQSPVVLTIEAADGGDPFVTFDGGSVTIGSKLFDATAVRLRVRAGDSAVTLPESEILLTPSDGGPCTLYLPAISLERRGSQALWISTNGSSFRARAGDEGPSFEEMLRHTPRPWKLHLPGLALEVFTSGLRMPVDIAFVPNPGTRPGDPLFYATELYGEIKVVRRDGRIETFAADLLNFNPTANFPGSGEIGIATMAVEPRSGDVFVTMAHARQDGRPESGVSGRVLRLQSTSGGLRAGARTTVFDTWPDTLGPSHMMSRINIGPDDRLYVHVGDSFIPEAAYDLDSFRGKILRMEQDGSPAADNPFYDTADGIGPADYVYAYGFRNPFGGAFRARDGALYIAESGPQVDRFARIDEGAGYGWDSDQDGIATNDDMRTRATYNWTPPAHAPVSMTFIDDLHFGDSGLPAAVLGRAVVAEFGQAFAPGPIPKGGKRLTEFVLSANGSRLLEEPRPVVVYEGHGRTSVSSVAAGPDGLYFTEFFVDDPANMDPTKRGARVWRLFVP